MSSLYLRSPSTRAPHNPHRRLLASIAPHKRRALSEAYTKQAPAQTTVVETEQQAPDEYTVATERLQTLLTDAALSNKDTVPIDVLDACDAEERLTLFTNLGTLSILLAIITCWIFGEYDPLGGIGLDGYTLDAALQGAAYAVPLLLCSLASRTPVKKAFPVLEEMHDMQHDIFRHFTAGMNMPQTCILLIFLVLPSLMLLLPACKALLVWAGYFLQQALLQPFGSVLHVRPMHLGPLAQVLPPVLSSYMAGLVAASCFNVRPKQIEVVRDALRSADAYFRLTCSTPVTQALPKRRPAPPPHTGNAPPTVFASSTLVMSSTEDDECEEAQQAPGSSGADSSGGQAAADAFRAVAMVWLLSRRRVARLTYILTSLDVAYLGVIWQATGNLATPAAAAFLHAAAECCLGECHQHQQGKAKAPVLVKTRDQQKQ